MSSRSFISAAQ